jgi:uncharacterized protein (TIGR01244 family)
MKRSGAWLAVRSMLQRMLSIVCVVLAMGVISVQSRSDADRSPAKASTPKNIDQTPPLVPIPDARVTPDGLLIGGQPSPEQITAIQEAGYRTVVTLRPHSERGDEGEQAAVERLGMRFVRIPVADAPGLTEDNARALAKTLAEEDALPAVVHCSTGQRVSALLGLKAFVVDRMSAAAAIDLAKSLGMKKFEGALRQRIAAICKTDKSRNCEDLP